MDESYIFLLDLAPRKLLGQLAMGVVIFRDDDEPAGLFVETVNDAWTQVAADCRQAGEMMQQRVDQRAAIALVFSVWIDGTGAGVDHHPGRLVDDRKIVVFVDDVERNFFGEGTQRRAAGWAEDRDAFIAAKLHRGLRGSIIDQHLLLRDKLLHARAAYVQTDGKQLIQTLPGVIFAHQN